MTATIRVTVSIQKALFDRAESLGRQLNISRSQLFGLAIEDLIRNHEPRALLGENSKVDEEQSDSNKQARIRHQETAGSMQTSGARKKISQGDVYWVPLEATSGSEPGYTHPHVVIQDNVFNRSRISTVVVCALTTNMKRAKAPGNVFLEAGEANLPRQSVVVVSQVSTVEKTQLGEYIGSLSEQRIDQILAGMQFLQSMTESREISAAEE